MNNNLPIKIKKIIEVLKKNEIKFQGDFYIFNEIDSNNIKNELDQLKISYEIIDVDNYKIQFQKFLGNIKLFHFRNVSKLFDENHLEQNFIVFDDDFNYIFFEKKNKKFIFNNSISDDLKKLVLNIYYYYKLFNMLKSNDFSDHFNDANNQIIVYSEKNGIFKIEYDTKPKFLFDKNYESEISKIFEILKSIELKIFFKNNLFSITNNSVKISIDELIYKSDDLYKKTLRDYELYSKKFEFSKFKDNLYKEKEKYFLGIREVINKIYSQAISIPILVSATTLASYKFPNLIFINIIILLIFIIYAVFYNKILIFYIKDLECLKEDFERDFTIINQKSGLDKDIINVEKDVINNKIKHSINFIKFYKKMLNFIVFISSIYILYNGFQDKYYLFFNFIKSIAII